VPIKWYRIYYRKGVFLPSAELAVGRLAEGRKSQGAV